MSNPYSNINFDVFSQVAEEKLTKGEHNKIMKDFYQKAGCYNKKRTQRRSMAAIAACLILCLAISPIGNATWAAVKQAFMGIGQYLGMSRQDDYVTVVDQTQTKNGITVTLNDAIGSDNELRVSVTALHEDGKALRKTGVEISDLTINGINRYNGFGSFGTNGYDPKEMHFMGTDFNQFENFEMPLNAKIDISIYAEGELFDFSFILDNKAFKEASYAADINRTIIYHGKRLILRQLMVTPIDQKITFDNPDNLDIWKNHNVNIYGVDNLGNEISFSISSLDDTFDGYRVNEDATTFQINPDVTSFTLRAYNWDDADNDDLWNPENAISDEFTVKIK